ncbi:MAG: hypothetical protein JW904_10325 [Spirochaetales bacterium]|nr:hypothetical protein [Spirochaetales bacterium]
MPYAVITHEGQGESASRLECSGKTVTAITSILDITAFLMDSGDQNIHTKN